MAEILRFPDRSKPAAAEACEQVWQCGKCEHQRFQLIQGGEIRCGECGAISQLRHFDPAVPL